MILLSDKTKTNTFLAGIVFLFVGLTFSKAITSLVTVYFLVLYLIQKDSKYPFALLKKNKSLRVFLLLVTWMIISLLWSNDKKAGIQSLGANLNFFIWPILMVLFSEQVKRFQKYIFSIFALIVTLIAIIQFIVFQSKEGQLDIREMALHVSHIRFALMIIISFLICIYFVINEQKTTLKFSWILISIWLLFYTYYSQVLSGILGLLGGGIGIIVFLLFNKFNYLQKGIAILSLILSLLSIYWLSVDITSFENQSLPQKLVTDTQLGNKYEHKMHSKITENGHFLDLYYCEKEVDSVWKLRSTKSLESLSPRGYQYKFVLKRYMTSKGLRKDAHGVRALTKNDIKNIENGIPTIVELQTGFLARYNQLKYEFSGNLDPNGHSILQRLEFWKASKLIIKENWILGVGLGSSKNTFLKTYRKMNSKLLIENQWESHNQFLSVWVSYGIIGLLLFIFWLFSIFQNLVRKHWLNLAIFFVLLFSFLVEDTLGTLTGMTLFGFFAGIFQNKISTNQD